MKKRNRNGANDKAIIERRKIKQVALQHSSDNVGYQTFPDVPNKDTFGPPKFSHISGGKLRGNYRLSPLDSNGAMI